MGLLLSLPLKVRLPVRKRNSAQRLAGSCEATEGRKQGLKKPSPEHSTVFGEYISGNPRNFSGKNSYAFSTKM